MFDKTLKAILLLSPLAYVKGVHLDSVDLKAFPLYAAVLFTASLFSKPQRNINFRPLSYILLIGGYSLFITRFNSTVLSAFINLFLAILIILLIVIHAKEPKEYYKYLMWAGLLNIFVWAGQLNGFAPILTNVNGEPGGVLGNAPRMCMYFTLILPFVFKVNVIVYILFGAIGALTGEWILPFLALIFGMMLFLKGKLSFANFNAITLCGITIMLTGAGLFLLKDHIFLSFARRWVLWKPTIMQIFQEPVRGYGLGIFPHVSGQFIKVPYIVPGISTFYHADTAFSSILQFIFNVGAIGIAWIMYAGWYIKTHFRVTAPMLGVIALVILSMVEYPFEVPKLWPTICFIIATMFIEHERSLQCK